MDRGKKDYSSYIFFIVLTLIILGGIFLILNNVFNKDNLNIKTIEVSGQAESEQLAKIAYIYLGYNNLNETAEKAEQQNSIIINTIKNSLILKGIKEENIETESYYLNEEYSWDNGNQEFKGYRVYHTLKIKSEEVTNVGFIITSAINSGANFVNNIEFTLNDEEMSNLKKQALIDASKNAKEKAEAMALGSGSKIKSLKSISDTTFNYSPWRYDIMYSKEASTVSSGSNSGDFDESTVANINVGKVTVSASVRAIFEIE